MMAADVSWLWHGNKYEQFKATFEVCTQTSGSVEEQELMNAEENNDRYLYFRRRGGVGGICHNLMTSPCHYILQC